MEAVGADTLPNEVGKNHINLMGQPDKKGNE